MASSQSPTVSVVIPCFNGIEYVEEAIQSAFNQTHPPLEVIVIDDGSTDGSLQHLYTLKNQYFHDLIVLTHPDHQNKGVSSSRQLGINQAKGEFIAFLDCDDIFLPNKLKVQAELLALNPKVVMCHTGIRIIGDRISAKELESHFSSAPCKPYSLHDQSYYLIQNNICNSSVLVSTREIRGISFSAPMLYQYEDWACWSLLAERGRFIMSAEQLVGYRVHPSSFSYVNDKSKQKILFSKLECQLVMISRTQGIVHTFRVLLAMLKTIQQLYKCYYPSTQLVHGTNRISNSILFRLRSAIKESR